ncbi:MAG: hypothetical protein V3U11_10925, partial [Planctomycetota bacterium]
MSTRKIRKSNLCKALEALAGCVWHPGRIFRGLARGLAGIYREQVMRQSPLPAVALGQLVPRDAVVELADFQGREGNVTLSELLVISAVVSHRQPR